MTHDPLFTPWNLGDLTLKNRFVLAPMTRNRASADGVPGTLAALYYVQRAGAGLIVTEGSPVSAQGVGYANTPGIHTAAQVEGWRRVTDAVHEAGSRIFLQLWHVGRVSHPVFHGGALPVAPSAIGFDGEAFTPDGFRPVPVPRALGADEIPRIVDDFHRAARNAKGAGFDGVEIHGANGYLVDQFLRDGTNRRDDDWGGDPPRRSRFLVEVTRAAADVWGVDRVGVRLSPYFPLHGTNDGDPEATFGHAIRAIGALGVAYVHFVDPTGEAIDRLAPLFPRTVIANGRYDHARARAVVERGRAALVSFGTSFLANPDLPERFRAGAPLNEPDPATFYGGDARGYVDYPSLGSPVHQDEGPGRSRALV